MAARAGAITHPPKPAAAAVVRKERRESWLVMVWTLACSVMAHSRGQGCVVIIAKSAVGVKSEQTEQSKTPFASSKCDKLPIGNRGAVHPFSRSRLEVLYPPLACPRGF